MKVVLNCVGPYRFLGERVVRACVESGASHIDISGEEQFIASMHLKYDDRAKEKGCYVIKRNVKYSHRVARKGAHCGRRSLKWLTVQFRGKKQLQKPGLLLPH